LRDRPSPAFIKDRPAIARGVRASRKKTLTAAGLDPAKKRSCAIEPPAPVP